MRHFTGPGQDEDQMWPGPTYGTCPRCGRSSETYYDELCRWCAHRPKSKRKKRKV